MSEWPTCDLCKRNLPLGPIFLSEHHGFPGLTLCPSCMESYREAVGWGRVWTSIVLRYRSLTRRR